jgi:hypothetical protein
MTRTQELFYLKSHYFQNANQQNKYEFTVELCDSITELTEIHIYERVAKRELYANSKSSTESYKLTIDNTHTAIIISDFDMRNADNEDIEEFTDMCMQECFDLDYNTIDIRIRQLS